MTWVVACALGHTHAFKEGSLLLRFVAPPDFRAPSPSFQVDIAFADDLERAGLFVTGTSPVWPIT